MERVDSAQVIFMSGRMHINSTSVRSACVRSYGYNKSKVQYGGFYSLMSVMRDPPHEDA